MKLHDVRCTCKTCMNQIIYIYIYVCKLRGNIAQISNKLNYKIPAQI